MTSSSSAALGLCARGTSRTTRRSSRRSTSAAASRARSSALADVEVEAAAVHQRVIRAERRQAAARWSAASPRRPGPSAASRRVLPVRGVGAQRLERLAHGAEALGADVVDGEPRPRRGADARVGQVVGVDELIEVVAVAEHRNAAALLDPVEEDLKDAEAAVADDRARPDDGDVEPVLARRRFAPAARRRAWPRRTPRAAAASALSSTGFFAGTPNTALDEVCTTLRTPRRARRLRGGSRCRRGSPTRTAARSLASGTCATLW